MRDATVAWARRRPRWFGFAAAGGLTLFLVACGQPAVVNPQVPPEGSSDFKAGYRDGCDSGFADAAWYNYKGRFTKDDDQYSSNEDYHKGWDDGHTACYKFGIRYPRNSGTPNN